MFFEWPRKQGVPGTPQEALKRAASLLREWRRVTKTGSSPFSDLAIAIDKRAAQASPYVFGEQFTVTDTPGRDGAWVSISLTILVTQLTIHYWANP